ncbi:MAG: ExeA family protein [Planctomycetota bacterium]|jgi:type II secretory pathway predicted ATPase ExeA/peptidoglycan hydrolase-like protein with peptidoglycan-binding domain
MYEIFYGLREKPFSLVPDPDFLFLGGLHGAALNLLEYGLRGQASFTLISGEVGCGKTILIRRFLRMVDDSTTVGMVTNTPRSKGHILERILLAFNLNYRGKSEIEQYEILIKFLEEQQTRGRRTILIIDEAHNLDENSLEELRMLSNINVDKSLALQVVLVGQPEILELLNTRSLRQLAQRISVNFKLLPLTFPETRRYIRHRLRVAGGSPDIFEPTAIAVVHLLSGGIPRLINVLCDTALVYGFGESRETLDTTMIQEVARDMLRGGLEVLPAMIHNLATGDLLETADKLVASTDPDELDDEYVELAPLASSRANLTSISETIMSEASRTDPDQDSRDDNEVNVEAGEKLGVPRTVIPIVDTSATGRDGAGSRRMILVLAIFAAVAVIAGGLLWLYWPAIERMQAYWTDSTNQLATVDTSATTDIHPSTPASPLFNGDNSVGQTKSPGVPAPARRLTGEAAENNSSLAEASPKETARPPSSEAIAVSPPNNPAKLPSKAHTSQSGAGKGEQEPQADLDDEIAGSGAITVPTVLDNALARSGAGKGDFGAALVGLFERWKQHYPALVGAAPCDKAWNAGLSCYEREGSLDKLIRLNRPAIIGLRTADRGTAYALLIDDYEIMVPHDEVNSLMAGPFLLLWHPPSGYQGLLVEGQRGEIIVWLRAELRKILGGDPDVGEGDVFDAGLTQAVQEFQQRYGLQVDGIVGIESLIKINSANLGDKVPRLE